MKTAFDVITITLNPAIDRTVTIPNFRTGAVNRASEVRSTAGGKGVNVAAALADYGKEVAVTGFLGGENAAIFEQLFAEKAIADHFVRIAGTTRVGIKITDPEQHETTDINFPGARVEADNLTALNESLGQLEAKWFVLAGSLPPGVDPTIYGELTTSLKARGARVAVDASAEALRLAIEAGPSLIKPNISELEELTGTKLESPEAILAAAQSLIARGVEMVVVSMGADGAMFVTAEEALRATPPEITVRSTVGAGDAMVAGTIGALLDDLPLADCARLATAFSLDAISHLGAGINEPALISLRKTQTELQSLFPNPTNP
ncbi:MAG: 1-phosphofructokinase [Chthoniobacteraceae bacterium]